MTSGEFNRQVHHATESGVRLLFKWIEVGIKGFFSFVRLGIDAILGK